MNGVLLALCRACPQVQDLRHVLSVLKQPTDGNRYEMMERLVAYRTSRAADEIVGSATSVDALQEQVGCGGGL